MSQPATEGGSLLPPASAHGVRIPGLLLVGAAGRNAGKTELACKLIARTSASRTVYGIKVTTIRERDGLCPRGGAGCGVCSSLVGRYCLTQEVRVNTGSSSDTATGKQQLPSTSIMESIALTGKDTARLIEAGATKVFWLRCLKEALNEGLQALLGCVPEGTLLVCESNSLRHAADPDLFIVVKAASTTTMKESAREVIGLADALVESDGKQFSPPISDIALAGSQWALRRQATAMVVAGRIVPECRASNGSKQLHLDRKAAFMDVDEVQMVAKIVEQLEPQFHEVIVVSGNPERFGFLNVPIFQAPEIADKPMSAIVSAISRSRYDLNFVVDCTTPEVSPWLVSNLLRTSAGLPKGAGDSGSSPTAVADPEIVALVSQSGAPEPMLVINRKIALGKLAAGLRFGESDALALLGRCRVRPFRLQT